MMSLDSWILLWKVLLVVGVSLFALLATCVAIGGFFDVKRLLAILHQQHAAQQEAADGKPHDEDS
jgi:hypothetical protein